MFGEKHCFIIFTLNLSRSAVKNIKSEHSPGYIINTRLRSAKWLSANIITRYAVTRSRVFEEKMFVRNK